MVEAAGNAVEHAYRDVVDPARFGVELFQDGAGDVVVSVSDSGRWRPPPADPGFRGRGLAIISSLARDVDLSPGAAGTTLRFVFTPPAPAPVAAGSRAARAVDQRRAEEPAALDVSAVGEGRCLALSGDLDLAGSTAVREQLLAELAVPGPVTVDLTQLGFVSSAGAGLLLEVAERAVTRGDLDVLLPPTGEARRMLDLTGLTAAFQPEPEPDGRPI